MLNDIVAFNHEATPRAILTAVSIEHDPHVSPNDIIVGEASFTVYLDLALN